MASMTRPHPEANMFSGSVNPSFLHSEFKAAGHDIFSPTFNVNFTAPLPASGEDAPKKRSPATSSRSPSGPALKGVKRILGLLSPRRHHTLLSEGAAGLPKAARRPSYDSGNTSPVTSGSSCAPSPFSSQEDITVSSAEDLDSRLLDSQDLTTPHVYVRSMLKSGKGLACWKPRPRKPSSGQRGTVPGDVGTFSAEGGFKKTFNIWDNEDALRRAASVLGGPPFGLPFKSVTIEPEEIPRGNTIAEGASSHTIFSESGTDKISSFEFRCHSPHGAVLAATTSAELEELEDHAELREFIIRYPELIYRHANSIRRIDTDEPLYIITGCIKSDSWALGAFRGALPAPHDAMSLQNMTRDGDARSKYAWTRRSTSEAHFGLSDVKGVKDQTLFLRGFKLDFSQAFRTRMKRLPRAPNNGSSGNGHFDPSDASKPAGDREEPGGRRGTRHGDGGRSGPSGSGSSAFGSSSSASSPGYRSHQGQESTPCCSTGRSAHQEVSVQSFPRSLEGTCHPSDAINRYLLDVTGADFALCHDDDWRFALESLDAPDDFVSANADELEVDVHDGVAVLSRAPKDREGGHVPNQPTLTTSTVAPSAPRLSPAVRSLTADPYPCSPPSKNPSASGDGIGNGQRRPGKKRHGQSSSGTSHRPSTHQKILPDPQSNRATSHSRPPSYSSFSNSDPPTPSAHKAGGSVLGNTPGIQTSDSHRYSPAFDHLPTTTLDGCSSGDSPRLIAPSSVMHEGYGILNVPCSIQLGLRQTDATRHPPMGRSQSSKKQMCVYDDVQAKDVKAQSNSFSGKDAKKNKPTGACDSCKTLKVKCERKAEKEPCKQCSNGGQRCLITGRKTRRDPPKRERLIGRVQSQAKEVERLMRTLETEGSKAEKCPNLRSPSQSPVAGDRLDADTIPAPPSVGGHISWPPETRDVQIAVANGGLCGSDLHYYAHGRNGDFLVRSPVLGRHTYGGSDKKHSSFESLKAHWPVIQSSVSLGSPIPPTRIDSASPPPPYSAGTTNLLPPQRRSRVTVVCSECKRFKLKCDRRAPCESCTRRGTVDKCTYTHESEAKMSIPSWNNRLDIIFLNRSMPDLGSNLHAAMCFDREPSLSTPRIPGDGRTEPPRAICSPTVLPPVTKSTYRSECDSSIGVGPSTELRRSSQSTSRGTPTGVVTLQDDAGLWVIGAGLRGTRDAARTKSGCFTCRMRWRGGSDKIDGEPCGMCDRLRLEHISFGLNRPEWLRKTRNVATVHDRPKASVLPAAQDPGGSNIASGTPPSDTVPPDIVHDTSRVDGISDFENPSTGGNAWNLCRSFSLTPWTVKEKGGKGVYGHDAIESHIAPLDPALHMREMPNNSNLDRGRGMGPKPLPGVGGLSKGHALLEGQGLIRHQPYDILEPSLKAPHQPPCPPGDIQPLPRRAYYPTRRVPSWKTSPTLREEPAYSWRSQAAEIQSGGVNGSIVPLSVCTPWRSQAT